MMVYIRRHLEWTDSISTMKRYYNAGGTRVAMPPKITAGDRTGSGNPLWLEGDHLGSQSITTNSSGVRVAEERYMPWGESRYTYGTTPTTFKFTGQRVEAGLGLYFYGARWYDPLLARFVSADTVVPGAGNSQAYDRYAYTLNNPVRFTDPSGHNYCDSDNAIAEDCEGITELLPDKKCRSNADCYDAYLAYYQVVLLLGRIPTDEEFLYMTAITEYWAYTDFKGVAEIGQEALARNYFERCGKDGCHGSNTYRFLAGYEVWTGRANRVDGNAWDRAGDLIAGWQGGNNNAITSHVTTIVNMKGTDQAWTSGYADNRPWQWFGPFPWDTNNVPDIGYFPGDDAILTIDLGANRGFWMFTGIQDKNFRRDAWGPQEAMPE